MRKKLTKKQAKQLVNIGRYGSCGPEAMQIPKKTLERFAREREISLISKNLPNATKGIKKRISLTTRVGLRNPVLDYFFKEHNASLKKSVDKLEQNQSLLPTIKKAQASIDLKKCIVNIGEVVERGERSYIVQLPNGERIRVKSDVKKPGKFVLTHSGFIVGNASKREYKKYSEYY